MRLRSNPNWTGEDNSICFCFVTASDPTTWTTSFHIMTMGVDRPKSQPKFDSQHGTLLDLKWFLSEQNLFCFMFCFWSAPCVLFYRCYFLERRCLSSFHNLSHWTRGELILLYCLGTSLGNYMLFYIFLV